MYDQLTMEPLYLLAGLFGSACFLWLMFFLTRFLWNAITEFFKSPDLREAGIVAVSLMAWIASAIGGFWVLRTLLTPEA